MAEVKRVTPPLGAYGKYTVRSPWVISNTMSYRCISQRRVEEFVQTGKDLFKTIYEPLGLSEDVCKADLALGVVIIGLLSTNGDRLFIPDTYISSYPDQSGVVYDYTVLSVDLGPQPNTMDLSTLTEELKLVANKYTGVSLDAIEVHTHTAISTTTMTQEQFIDAEDARMIAIDNVETSEEVIARLNATIAQQNALIEQLIAQQS